MKNNKLKKVILSAITATMISCSLPFTALAASYRKFIYGFYQGCGCFYYARIRTKWY